MFLYKWFLLKYLFKEKQALLGCVSLNCTVAFSQGGGKWFFLYVNRKNSGAWGRWAASLLATEAFSWANLQREETRSTPDKFLTSFRKARLNQKKKKPTQNETS